MVREIKASVFHRFADPLPSGTIAVDVLPDEVRVVVERLRQHLKAGGSVVDTWAEADEPLDAPRWVVQINDDAESVNFISSTYSAGSDTRILLQFLETALPKIPRNVANEAFPKIQQRKGV